MLDRLPGDVLEQVLDNFTPPPVDVEKGATPLPWQLLQRVDTRSLAAVASICKSLKATAQARLFRHVGSCDIDESYRISRRVHAAVCPRNGDSGGVLARKTVLRSYVRSFVWSWIAPGSRHPDNSEAVLDLVRLCNQLEYLSIELIHREGDQRLPLEELHSAARQDKQIKTFNIRFIHVEPDSEELYLPAAFEFDLPHLQCFRIRGLPSAHLQNATVLPLPRLLYMAMDYVDFPHEDLSRYMTSLLSRSSQIREICLVNVKVPHDLIDTLGRLVGRSLEILIVDAEGSVINLDGPFERLHTLHLGLSAFPPMDLAHLPPTISTCFTFHPANLWHLVAFTELLARPDWLPKLRCCQIWDGENAFWDDEDTVQVPPFTAVMAEFSRACSERSIEILPPDYAERLAIAADKRARGGANVNGWSGVEDVYALQEWQADPRSA